MTDRERHHYERYVLPLTQALAAAMTLSRGCQTSHGMVKTPPDALAASMHDGICAAHKLLIEDEERKP